MTPADQLFAAAVAQHQRGAPAAAAAGYRAVLATAPDHLPAACSLATLLDPDAAERLLVHAGHCAPGNGLPFTRLATMRWRRRFGGPRPPRQAINRPLVSCFTLGANGRLGNQLLQYGVLGALATAQQADLATGDWIGRDLFDLDDPLCPPPTWPTIDDQHPALTAALAGTQALTDVDLLGYFQLPTGTWRFHRDKFRRHLRFGQAATSALAPALARCRDRTVVAIHVRHGDFLAGDGWVAPRAPYLHWLAELWPRLDRPLLYIASDDPAAARAFTDYAPLTAIDLAPNLAALDFVVDFAMLAHADHLAIANSTFSFCAALLNDRGGTVVRPVPGQDRLSAINPWDAKPLL